MFKTLLVMLIIVTNLISQYNQFLKIFFFTEIPSLFFLFQQFPCSLSQNFEILISVISQNLNIDFKRLKDPLTDPFKRLIIPKSAIKMKDASQLKI